MKEYSTFENWCLNIWWFCVIPKTLVMGRSYSYAEIQSAYLTAPANWDTFEVRKSHTPLHFLCNCLRGIFLSDSPIRIVFKQINLRQNTTNIYYHSRAEWTWSKGNEGVLHTPYISRIRALLSCSLESYQDIFTFVGEEGFLLHYRGYNQPHLQSSQSRDWLVESALWQTTLP